MSLYLFVCAVIALGILNNTEHKVNFVTKVIVVLFSGILIPLSIGRIIAESINNK